MKDLKILRSKNPKNDFKIYNDKKIYKLPAIKSIIAVICCGGLSNKRKKALTINNNPLPSGLK